MLNFQNGTVDLRTGELREHRREDLITKRVHFDYNLAAKCPQLDGFLKQVVSEEQLPLLWRAIGHSVTGHTSQKCIFPCWGPTNTGKTTFLNLVTETFFPEYSTLIRADSLLARGTYADSNAMSDLADLCGARFAQTSEMREGQRLDDATLKRITPGIGLIRGVRKYENAFSFSATHKLWGDTNHEVVATGTGDDVWGRNIPFEFGPRVPAEKIDRELAKRLGTEIEGLFARAVAEAKRWYVEGLGELPKRVGRGCAKSVA